MANAITKSNGLPDALQWLENALQLLDDCDAPAQIGAHVDLALCQLREQLEVVRGDQDDLIHSMLMSRAG